LVRHKRSGFTPSHTLLGVFVNNSGGDPAAQPWFEGLVPPGTAAVIQMPLIEGAKASLQGPRPAETDTRIFIHTLYVDEFGVLADSIFKLTTRVSDFSFGLELLPKPISAVRRGID
jgi:hypothetical protein